MGDSELKGQVHYEKRGDIALLTIDNPPVNPLSSGVRQGLSDGFNQAMNDASVVGIVLTGAGRSFIAGADISEFGGEMKGASLQDVLQLMENAPKPVVAAVNGSALGGGLEVALCCHYRLSGPGAIYGLPEVNLGLLPGAGGTQRLPRLIGAQAALSVMLTGTHLNPARALQTGIVEEVVEGDLIERSCEFAQEVAAGKRPLAKVRDRSDKIEADRASIDTIVAEAQKTVNRSRRGQNAPMRIIECVRTAVATDDFDTGLKREGELFLECLNDPQREAMIHVFFSERQTRRIPDIGPEVKPKDIKSAAVIGSGTMGGGIAMCFANVGIPVILLDRAQEDLDRGLGVIRGNYENQVNRNRIKQDQMDKRMGLIRPSLDYADVADVDITIEAVYENLELKCEIFKQLDSHAKAGAILASNTSALDIDRIADATSRPQDVVGTHFFSPANVMRLLEIVRGAKSSKEVLASAMNLGKTLRKIPVLAGNCRGFIGNRMLAGYTRQASLLSLEGAMPQQIDRVLYEFGMPMGPFQMFDLVGLDLGWRARKMAGGSNEITTRIPDTLCEMGNFGQKSGQGYYRYEKGSRAPIPVPEVEALIVKVSEELGIKRREISDDEILQRCIYPLINEGAKILEEGMALRSSDIDIVYINGYGFPWHRGGPMHYANSLGLDKVVAGLRELESQSGSSDWAPAKSLVALSEKGEKLQ